MHPPMEGWAKNRGCMCHILRVGRGGREVGASGAGGCGGSYAGKKNDLTPGLVTSPLVSLLDNEAIQTICIYSPVFIHQQSSRLLQRRSNKIQRRSITSRSSRGASLPFGLTMPSGSRYAPCAFGGINRSRRINWYHFLRYSFLHPEGSVAIPGCSIYVH